ncbi:Patatin-like phospholipase [Planctomycetes bacterium Poly30]|uniref:Patatin-like phospholipase n=1 Tax=Saltatorellus ferox TaxID=2528018 RepID=A0A518EQJ3_9BACT|nr:Patatin-like phospholipase [Planctomycetes bacterium Poly30]
MSDTEEPPIGPIALSLSGGGFRAAGFHLGVLTALQRADLLGQVRVLSTASGGTLLGARWLLGMARNEPFAESHYQVAHYLTESQPLRSAIRRAARERLTLTQAFAEELEATLFDDSRFSSPTLREIYESRTSIEEGSFNATIGRNGQPFRFTFSRGNSARIGNQDTHLPRKVAQHLRLSDVVAASCAFPGAFEPMVMPNDFTWPDLELAEAAAESFTGAPTGLVDGGVHDNQGISSMLLAAKRISGATASSGSPIDLFFVSDAERRLEAPEARTPRRKNRWSPTFKIWHVSALSWLAILGACASIFLTWKKVEAERTINDFRWPVDAIAFGVPIAVALTLIVGILYVRRVISQAFSPLKPHVGKKAWRSIQRVRVRDAIEAFQTRGKSLEAVAAYAFPQRVRSLVYQSVWSNSALKGKRAACHIYELLQDQFKHVDGLYAPTSDLLDAVGRAARLSTGLELASPAELEDLQVTGQATAIANLLEHLESRYGRDRAKWSLEVLELDGRLREDWNAINTSGKPLRPLGETDRSGRRKR